MLANPTMAESICSGCAKVLAPSDVLYTGVACTIVGLGIAGFETLSMFGIIPLLFHVR